jgi:hypothetical protein
LFSGGYALGTSVSISQTHFRFSRPYLRTRKFSELHGDGSWVWPAAGALEAMKDDSHKRI